MPQNRPVCLRPMLKREKYKILVDKINKALSWDPFSFEMLLLYPVVLCAPPFAEYFMVCLFKCPFLLFSIAFK
jgi:hypothetical protein